MPSSSSNPSSCPAAENPNLVGDPVDTLTGSVVDRKLDFRLIGPLEFNWVRHYDSSRSAERRALGWGQTHDFDRVLIFDVDGISYRPPVGKTLSFPPLLSDGETFSYQGYTLKRVTLWKYELSSNGEASMEFEFGDPKHPARIRRLFSGRHEILFFYTSDRRLEQIIDSAGRVIAVAEDVNGRITQLGVKDRPGQPGFLLLTYEYDREGNLASTRNGAGHGYQFSYDEKHRLTRRTGRKGFNFTFEYDATGRCVRSSGDRRIHQVELTYEIPGRVTRVLKSDGGEWTYFFDEAGLLSQIIDPLGGAKKYVRDEGGRLTHEVDANENATEILYNAAGAAVAKLPPASPAIPLPEEPNSPDPKWHRVAANPLEYEFGALLDRKEVTLPESQIVQSMNLAPAVRDLATIRRKLETAELSGRRDQASPLGILWWPAPSTGRIFSDLGKLIEQLDEDGNRRKWKYDASGNLESHTDFDGSDWAYRYDTWHFLLGQTDPSGGKVDFTYTTEGEVETFTDARGTRSEYAYDAKNHLTEIRRHGVVKDIYVRDAEGNLLQKKGADGRVLLDFEVGPGNLPLKRTLASGDEHTFEYDSQGRHLAGNTKKDKVAIAYDAFGNRRSELRNGLGVVHTYLSKNRLLGSMFFGNYSVSRDYKADGSVVITDPLGKTHRILLHKHGFIERRYANGTSEISQYDAKGRCLFKSAKPENRYAWNRRYHWSGEGELRRVEDNLHGETSHDYDASHRLTRRVLPGGVVEEYATDAAGNITRKPGVEWMSLIDGNRLERVDGHAFTYNDRNHADSRETPQGKLNYVYDSRDQLVAIHGLRGEWTAEYDTFGRRTRKTWAGKTTEYYWYGDQLIAEVQPDGKLRLYVHADPLAMTPLLFIDYESIDAPSNTGKCYYIHSNQIGAPVLIEDHAGIEVWRASVDPFGTVVVAEGAKISFTLRQPGHFHDPETGLHYNRFRYYDPVLGRYLQSDPWGITGGFNLYAYRPNPLLQVDVRGLGEEGTPGCKPKDDEESNKPLNERKGWVDEYGEQKKVTGDGSCDRDHQPSKAALKERAAQLAKRDLTKAEKAAIDAAGLAVVVPKDIHKEGDTYGGKNTSERVAEDASDLAKAANRDADSMMKNAKEKDPANLEKYQEAADKIKSKTNDDYDNMLKKILKLPPYK